MPELKLSDIKSRLIDILADQDLVSTEAQDKINYGQDWTRFFKPNPALVVFPRTIEHVQKIVLLANELDLALVPSGGRTGLSGGAVAQNSEIVVSFEKMNEISNFNAVDGTVVVQAGVITQALQAFALQQDMFYPVDFASSGSSQIGGNIATNAGGIKVLRYGLTRDWVLGLTVVTGSGQVLTLNHDLVKNATGYDLRHLFIGSEGTLGFIVEATMRLAKIPKNLTVVLLAIPKMVDIISVLQAFRAKIELSAFEFFSEAALQHVLVHGDKTHPFAETANYYALLEFEDESGEKLELAMAAFENCVDAAWVVDGIVSQSEKQRLDLWHYREAISESITPFTPYKNDIAVRVSLVPAFLAEIETMVNQEYPDFEIVWFGHIGDGNLHLNILRPKDWPIDKFKRECELVSEQVLSIVQQYDGSISAEHGVGLLKKNQLPYSRSTAEIELMRSLKLVFDPKGIMNPGKLIDLP